MQNFDKIDLDTLKYLKFIYSKKVCKISDLFRSFGVNNISDTPIPVATILYLLKHDYLVLFTPDNASVFSDNYDSYARKCAESQKPEITLECSLSLTMYGKWIVEESRRKSRYFNIPLIISIISAAVSASALLFQIFDKSPILVRILECLSR